MKIAITVQTDNTNPALEARFGRAPWIAVYDSDTSSSSIIDNRTIANFSQGAGIKCATSIVKLGISAVITGQVGPKALAVLRSGSVTVYTGATGLLWDAIEQYQESTLQHL